MSNELHTYDAGLLSDFGGGNVEWWQDYIRAELGRAHDFYEAQIASYTPPAASGQQEDLSAAILRIPCAAPDDIKGKGIFVYHYENGLRDGLRKAAELAAAHTEPAQQERATMGDCAKCKAIGAAYKIGSESASAPAEQARDAEIEALIAALKDCARHPRKSQRDNIVSKALAAIASQQKGGV